MSVTKKTLLKILREQLSSMQSQICNMNQQSLIKQLAKQKIIYSISKKQNKIDLVYSHFALAEFYLINQLYEPAIKCLREANQIMETGDALYMIGVAMWKGGKEKDRDREKDVEIFRLFQRCFQVQWIQPKPVHQESCQLEAISYLQKIIFDRLAKNPDKKDEIQKKIVDLCYQKMQVIKKFHSTESQNYFFALAMGDLAQVYKQFGDYQTASQKIKTAVKLLKDQKLGKQKQIQFLYLSAKISQHLKQEAQCQSDLRNAMELIEEKCKENKLEKFTKIYQNIYYLYIKKVLNV